jgi:hypothetical protein
LVLLRYRDKKLSVSLCVFVRRFCGIPASTVVIEGYVVVAFTLGSVVVSARQVLVPLAYVLRSPRAWQDAALCGTSGDSGSLA